jgi:hypothetical protein
MKVVIIMGWRYRKSKKIGGFRINFSKSGIGYSYGAKGARITKMANGRTRTTISIPETGISYVSERGRRKKKTSQQPLTFEESSRLVRISFAIILIIILIIAFVIIIKVSGNTAIFDNTVASDNELMHKENGSSIGVDSKDIIYNENHPRIYDPIESVNQYILGLDNNTVKLLSSSEFARVNYDGAQSELDGVLTYCKGYTLNDLTTNIRIIIDDELASEIDVDSAMELFNTYLPEDFYAVYKFDIAYIRGDENTTIYTAAFRLKNESANYPYYFSIYILHKYGESESWVLENDFEAYGGLDKGKAEKQQTWDYNFYK